MLATTAVAVVAWWIIEAIKQFEHVADLGDMEWFDQQFADYDWDDWYDPA